jgi:hypothetical protein
VVLGLALSFCGSRGRGCVGKILFQESGKVLNEQDEDEEQRDQQGQEDEYEEYDQGQEDDREGDWQDEGYEGDSPNEGDSDASRDECLFEELDRSHGEVYCMLVYRFDS